jgi:prepilin-type N-terminal cleavage/methylation domain-containing protein/prepilin-type processing-associated H-X9-DG protein
MATANATRRTRKRPGFSMLEVMMVIFIISVLLSIVLPALLAGRDSAQRVSCLNNLRQMSLALGNYESHYQVLPPGVVNPTRPIHNRPDNLHISWLIQLMPFMEQMRLAESFDPALPVYAPENNTVRVVGPRTLVCPSDVRTTRKLPYAATSYAACHHDVEAPIDVDNQGVFYLNSSVSHADLIDGSSNTIFVGEKLSDSRDLGWLSGTRATLRNTGTPLNAGLAAILADKPISDDDDPDDLRVGGFGSFHKGGANFIFGDGSVRFISQTIAPSVYRFLGHRADGEMLEEGAF